MKQHQLYAMIGLAAFIVVIFLLSPELSAKSATVLIPISCSSYNTNFNYSGPSHLTTAVNATEFGKFLIYNTGNVTENISIDARPENGATLSVQNAPPFEAEPGNTRYYTEIGLPTGSNPGNYTLIVNLTSSYDSCQTSHIVYVNVTVPVNS
jgi:hypothetical protein